MPATNAAPRARLPRTFADLEAHPWVDWIDDSRHLGDGLHVYLKPGFVWADATSAVVEPTVREACQAFREVEWNPAAWGEACGASPAEVAALTGEAVPSIADAALEASAALNAEGQAATARALAGLGRIRAGLEALEALEVPRPVLPGEATPAPAEAAPAGRRLNPLAEMVLTRLQAAEGQWLMVEAAPIVDTLKGLGWLQRSDIQGLIGPDRIPAVECRITAAGLAALAEAAPSPRPVLPGEATPPPAPSHGEAAPRLPELCPATPGTPTRAEAVRDVERRDGGGVAVICSGSDREAFRLPDTVSHCGAAAALEAAGWLLSHELEALAQRWRDISGDQPPSAEAVAIAEAAAPLARSFEVFHRTWWRAPGVPGVGISHHIGWAQTEARARYLCRRWNASHPAGPLSDRSEYTAA